MNEQGEQGDFLFFFFILEIFVWKENAFQFMIMCVYNLSMI